MTNDFYDSTIRYESSMNADKNALELDFINLVVQRYRSACGINVPTSIEELSVYNIATDSNTISFSMSTDDARVGFTVMIYVSTIDYPGRNALYNHGYIVPLFFSQISPVDFDPSSLFIPSSVTESTHPTSCRSKGSPITIPLSLGAKMMNYWNAVERGLPSSVSNNIPRMLYFSATTITTLGLGDIVPTTDETRLVVTTESLVGIVTIGLFLNSLSRPR